MEHHHITHNDHTHNNMDYYTKPMIILLIAYYFKIPAMLVFLINHIDWAHVHIYPIVGEIINYGAGVIGAIAGFFSIKRNFLDSYWENKKNKKNGVK